MRAIQGTLSMTLTKGGPGLLCWQASAPFSYKVNNTFKITDNAEQDDGSVGDEEWVGDDNNDTNGDMLNKLPL